MFRAMTDAYYDSHMRGLLLRERGQRGRSFVFYDNTQARSMATRDSNDLKSWLSNARHHAVGGTISQNRVGAHGISATALSFNESLSLSLPAGADYVPSFGWRWGIQTLWLHQPGPRSYHSWAMARYTRSLLCSASHRCTRGHVSGLSKAGLVSIPDWGLVSCYPEKGDMEAAAAF